MFGIRGVDIHSQLRMIFIIATHQLNTYTTNPLSSILSNPVPPQSKPNPILIIPIPTPTVLLPSYRSLTHTPLPLFLTHIIPPIYTLYYPIYPQKHTPHSKDPYSQSEFF